MSTAGGAGRRWRLGEAPWAGGGRPPFCRVILDNDFAGDPDDLVQLAHHVLSPSVDVRAVISSHLAPGDAFHPGPGSAAAGVRRVHELFDVMGLDAADVVLEGADTALRDREIPHVTAGARAIVEEAMRDDVDTPLYVACGGGLTDVASAWLLEPAIAERLTLVWIGGPEYPGLAYPPPGVGDPEYNLAIDVTAAQVVLEDSDLWLWQVPRDAYRQCLVSEAELRHRMAPAGPLGAYLHGALRDVAGILGRDRHPETYSLGDQPLVLLTALQSYFDPDTSSSAHVVLPAPLVDDTGRVTPADTGHPIRVYTRIDTRLVMEDLYAKLAGFAQWQGIPEAPSDLG